MTKIAVYDGLLPILDSLESDLPDNFVFRARNEEMAYEKLYKMLDRIPKSKDVAIYEIGYRPDRPIPVTRFFVEIQIRKHEPWHIGYNLFWSLVVSGKKEED